MSENYEVPELVTKQIITLEGLCGEFNTVNSNFRVRFFSTYANGSDFNHGSLLDELKPMRERLDISQIRNINQVLQRDLDDYRIANGLIPYLLNLVTPGRNNVNHIAFFPAILGVLIPKNYIVKNDGPEILYPKMNDQNGEYCYYNDSEENFLWKIKRIKQGNRYSRLSVLEFDKNQSEIIVLDGQHRANAFRVVTEKFFDNQSNEIYRPYYKDTGVYPTDIQSDLPVTLICFESINTSAKVLPDDISRKLFIDVNNSAKSISPSRQVLLDDVEPSSLLTNTFYSRIAEIYGFKIDTNDLSLIHLGFDVNHSLRNRTKNSILNISNPELLRSVFDWFFFGSRTYNSLDQYSVKKESTLKWQPGILSGLLPESRQYIDKTKNEDGEEIKVLINPEKKSVIVDEFNRLYFSSFYKILSEINFLKNHFKAATKLHLERSQGLWDPRVNTIWDEVFLGGEGLYYSFEKLLSGYGRSRPDLIEIKNAISNLENKFSSVRATENTLSVEDSDSIYTGFQSIAFQIALFMSFYSELILHRVDLTSQSKINEAVDEYIKKLNLISVEKWSKIFNKVRPLLWKGDTDPKKWPSYHKLILRLIQGDGQYFNSGNDFNYSPEAIIFSNLFKNQLDGFINSSMTPTEVDTMLATDFKKRYKDQIAEWKKSAKKQVEDLFTEQLELELLALDYNKLVKDILDYSFQTSQSED